MRRWREIYSLHFPIFSIFPPSLTISYFKQDKVNFAVSEKEVGCDSVDKDDKVDRGGDLLRSVRFIMV